MEQLFEKYNISMTEEKKQKFFKFFCFLTEENAKYNLTAVTGERDVYLKHFVDSVWIVDMLKGGKLLDVGSGGGMPGIPLAILRGNIEFTLLEATGKKCRFLESAVRLLELKNVRVINGRAEELAKTELRESFDTVTARGVARLNTLAEYCLPFVKTGGIFAAYKGDAEEEIEEAKNAVNLLGGKFRKTEKILLEGAKREIVLIEKVKKTPAEYPRGRGKERKDPL